jgi:hypothetical protein
MHFRPLAASSLVAALCASALAAPRVESHAIECVLDPAKSTIYATDKLVVVRDAGGPLVFEMNAALAIESVSVDGRKSSAFERVGGDAWTAKWRLDVPPDGGAQAFVEIRYSGAIADQVKKSEDLSFVVGDDTRGVICADGVYLTAGSGWYPDDGGMTRFDVKASIPEPYLVVTQGTHDEKAGTWTGKYAADGLALVAGKWKHEERKIAGGIVIGTYLGETTAPHAKLLLDATESILKKYGELLGPYAYDRFDVVENWFTTGFGMPEYTLLGRDVIGMRMIPESQRTGSIPSGYLDHEIVHSWWGNLVFPDFKNGNWCEGLTSYCANYMSQEWKSPADAVEYRRRACLRFTLGATPEKDYPVRKFVTKTEDVDNDVGYGKCSMIFHALRRDLGDDAFWGTLRRVSKDARGKRFTWADWQREFEKTSQRNLDDFFKQALDRKGAPLFAIKEVAVAADNGRLRVSGTLTQTLAEGETPWRVTVPVVVEHLEGREESLVDCVSAETRFSVIVPSLPLRVTVDPDWHVFRRLAEDEVPPCLAATIGRPSKVFVYPDGDEALKAAAEMGAARSGCKAIPASEAPAEPAKKTSYVVFGDAARVPLLATLAKTMPRHFPSARASETTTILASARSPADPAEFVTTFVGAPAALAGRARAVFYYQYDGRIAFDGKVAKDKSQVATTSRATRTLLPDIQGASSPADVKAMIDRLAAPEMNGRLAGGPEEKKVRALIAEQFTLAGCVVDEQAFAFEVKGRHGGSPGLWIAEAIPPKPAAAPGEPTITLERGGAGVDGATTLVASPASDWIDLKSVESAPESELKGSALLIELGAAQEDVLSTLRSASDLAKSRGAVALIVRLPESPTKPMTDLFRFPGDMVTSKPGATPTPMTAYAAAGTAARTGSNVELSLPTIAVPHGFNATTKNLYVHVLFTREQVSTANVVARIKATGKQRRPGVVVLGAHYDHLGAGFAGADDDASGVAALCEAARVLSAHADLLGRDVVLVAFGAEEWGLRGSKAFVDAWPKDQPIVAMINADTVGRRGVQDVNVLGGSKHPRLAKIVAAALEQSFLTVAKDDIDKYAYAWGSDHWSFHEAGIDAVDLWSGDYAVMHTAGDTADGVDAVKVSRIGRALAIAAFAVAGGF